ncbi:MAG TPA: DUF6188 family protein [Dongiaceae bacterium]|jgi:hypothetical protein|nr:DUF6188 family protein [Dongiaceae bacterium]
MSSEQTSEAFLLSLGSCRLTAIERHEFSWSFYFGKAVTLVVEGCWRILAEGRISLASSDDEQTFGLSDPVDARARASHLVVGQTVRDVSVRRDTGDLTISFGEGFALEALNVSSGYEAWQLSKPQVGTLVCIGGGKLVFA